MKEKDFEELQVRFTDQKEDKEYMYWTYPSPDDLIVGTKHHEQDGWKLEESFGPVVMDEVKVWAAKYSRRKNAGPGDGSPTPTSSGTLLA